VLRQCADIVEMTAAKYMGFKLIMTEKSISRRAEEDPEGN